MDIDSPTKGFRNTNVERDARAASLELLHARMPAILAANVINSGLIALIFFGSVPLLPLASWTCAQTLTCGVRGWFWFRYRNWHIEDWTGKWSRIAVMGSSVAGMLWGAAGFLFFIPHSPVHLAALVFVLGGMAAGALTTLSAHLSSLNAYLLLSLVPFLLRLIFEGGRDHIVMAAMALLFLLSLLAIGRRTHVALVQSFALRFENRDLLQSLEHRVADRTRRQATVVDFSQRALCGTEANDLLRDATATIMGGLDSSYAVATEWIPESDTLIVRAASSHQCLDVTNMTYAVGSGTPAAEALRKGTPAVSADLRRGHLVAPPPVHDCNVVSMISVPIQAAPRPIGTLEAWFRHPREHTEDDVDFVRAVANTAAAGLQRNRAELAVQRMALHDPLTGLPNRALFLNNLSQAITHAHRHGSLIALLLIDLDDFKDVNDSLGHTAGDELLTEVGRRLRECLRKADPPTRLGGDEFALILAELDHLDGAATVAEKVQEMLREPFFIRSHEIFLSASVGITVCPPDGSDPGKLLSNADLALYRAKAQGRSCYQFYSPEMARSVENRMSLIRDLRHAVAGQELQLEYQPQIKLASGRVACVEALLRWHNSKRGLLFPETFIPIAETCGLITALGDWTIRQASVQAEQWRSNGLPRFCTAVNVSLAQWRREDPVSSIERILQGGMSAPHLLELEITEREFPLTGERRLLESLGRLRQIGISIAIDDFGTGHSNLARLRALPVDRIKIDRSFVSGIGNDTDAETIVKAIITLGRNLGVEVVAEGVEVKTQVDFLRSEGCACAQGYYLGRPMLPEELGHFLCNDLQTPSSAFCPSDNA